MKIYYYLAVVLIFCGCSSARRPVSVSVDDPSVKFDSRRADHLLELLESSRSFHILLNEVKVPSVIVEGESGGWLDLELASSTDDFMHRWGTLKVEEKTGRILRQETDKNYEYIWINDKEVNPQANHSTANTGVPK